MFIQLTLYKYIELGKKKKQANFQVLSLATMHSSGLGREYAQHGNSENKCLTSEILSDLYRKPQEQKDSLENRKYIFANCT